MVDCEAAEHDSHWARSRDAHRLVAADIEDAAKCGRGLHQPRTAETTSCDMGEAANWRPSSCTTSGWPRGPHRQIAAGPCRSHPSAVVPTTLKKRPMTTGRPNWRAQASVRNSSMALLAPYDQRGRVVDRKPDRRPRSTSAWDSCHTLRSCWRERIDRLPDDAGGKARRARAASDRYCARSSAAARGRSGRRRRQPQGDRPQPMPSSEWRTRAGSPIEPRMSRRGDDGRRSGC